MSDNVDNPHQKNIDVVMAILEEIRQRAEEAEKKKKKEEEQCVADASHWLDTPGIPEHNNVISILGGRGTGKTTLVRQLVKKLRKEKQDLVVGPITPMGFRETRSLFSYVLTTLYEELFGEKNNKKICDPCQAENKTELELEKNLRDMRNYVARTIPVSLKTLVQSGKPGEDFAYHYNTIQEKHVKAKKRYPDLVTQILDHRASQLCQTDREKKRGLLVVVMDDCDLFPDLIRIVLDDIQRMCESPRVALLFASNEKALFRVVGEKFLDNKEITAIKYLDKTGLSSPQMLVEETTLYIHKVFPINQQIHLTWRADYGNRLNFKPLVDDPNLADFVLLGGNRESRPSLYELMQSISFGKPAYPHIPNLAALFAWSKLSENEISRSTQGDYLFTPFCELLPETPRGLFILYQMLARFYRAHASEKETNVLENNHIEQLIQILIDISLYGALPSQRELLRAYLYFWSSNGRVSLDIRGKGAVWNTPKNPKSLLFFKIKEGFHQIKEGVSVEVRHFQECGLFPWPPQSDDAKKALDNPDLSRLIELVQTVTVASGFTTQTTSDLPVATLSPPHGLKSTVLVSGSLDRPDNSIVFPFWLDRPFPNYSAFFLYRRIWNDHVTGLIRFRETFGEGQLEDETTNQIILDYLVILHLHLVALCINITCQAIPTATPIKTIQDALKNRKERFLEYVDACVVKSPKQLDDKQMITANATFYLACALFSFDPMASKGTAEWIRVQIIAPLGKQDRAYQEPLFRQIWQLVSEGQYLPVLETRPEGFALLTGIHNVLSVLDSDSDSFKKSENWKDLIQSSLTKWNNRTDSDQVLPYPAHGSRGERISRPVPSVTTHHKSKTAVLTDLDNSFSSEEGTSGAIVKILDDSFWEIKMMLPDTPETKDQNILDTIEKLTSHHRMLVEGKNQNSALLELVEQDHQKWFGYTDDFKKTVIALVGNCAVELEKRRFLEEAEKVYSYIFRGDGKTCNYISGPGQYHILPLHLQYANFLINQGKYDEASHVLDHETFSGNFEKETLLLKLEVKKKYAQKLKPFEILKTSITLKALTFGRTIKEADIMCAQVFYLIVLDKIQMDDTLGVDEKLIQSWNVWQVMFYWIKNKTPAENKTYRRRKAIALHALALFLFNTRRTNEHAEPIKMLTKKLFIMLQKNYLDEIPYEKLDKVKYFTAILCSEDNEKEIATALLLESYEKMSLDTAHSFYLSNSLRALDRPGLAEQVRQGQKIRWENDSTIKEYVDNGLKKFDSMVRLSASETPLLNELKNILGQLPAHEKNIFVRPRRNT